MNFRHRFTTILEKKLLYKKCPIFMKLEFSRQIFEKFSNIKFHENPSNGIRVVPCERMDRHGELNILFSQFCRVKYSLLRNFENASKKIDIFELVACRIPLKMNASNDPQNAVSQTLPYATTVTCPVHTHPYAARDYFNRFDDAVRLSSRMDFLYLPYCLYQLDALFAN